MPQSAFTSFSLPNIISMLTAVNADANCESFVVQFVEEAEAVDNSQCCLRQDGGVSVIISLLWQTTGQQDRVSACAQLLTQGHCQGQSYNAPCYLSNKQLCL